MIRWSLAAGLFALGCQPPGSEKSTTAPTLPPASSASGAASQLPIRSKVKATAAATGLPAGPQVAGGSRIIVDSSSGDIYAWNAYTGARQNGPVLLRQNCPKDDPDCMWYFRSGMIVSARNTGLAVRPTDPKIEQSALILDANCTPEVPACSWVWQRGMLKNGADPNFAIIADGAREISSLLTVTTCSDTDPNCTFTIENARVSLGADFRTGLYAGVSPASGKPVELGRIWPELNGSPCPDGDLRCTWTFRRGRIYSDYDPSLAVDWSRTNDEYNVYMNGQCGDSPSCYWTYDGWGLVSDVSVPGMGNKDTQLALVPKGGPLTDLTQTTQPMGLGAMGADADAGTECAPGNGACAPGYLCEPNAHTIPDGGVTNDRCLAECQRREFSPNPSCFFEVGSPHPIVSSGAPAPRAKWSILMLHFVDGDFCFDSFLQQIRMGYGGSTQDVNILLYIDTPVVYGPMRSPQYRGHATFLRVNRNASPTILQEFVNEVDMGVDLDKFRDFASLAAAYFPADNYAVIEFDHGGAWTGFGSDADAGNNVPGHSISIPDGATNGGDTGAFGQMLAGMTQAFGKKVGVFGFDSCSNGAWEVAEASAPYVQYMVGSEAAMDALSYGQILPELAADPAMDPKRLAGIMVTTFSPGGAWLRTLSATDLSSSYFGATGTLTSAVNAFAHALRDPAYFACVEQARPRASTDHEVGYVDLYELANQVAVLCNSQNLAGLAANVETAVTGAVIANLSGTDPASSIPRGLSIYLPPRCGGVDMSYYPDPNYQTGKGAVWSQLTEWDDFLHGFAPPSQEPQPLTFPLIATTGANGTSATLTWALPTATGGVPHDGMHYVLRRGTSPGLEDVIVAQGWNLTTYTDSGLDPNQTYYYRASTKNCSLSMSNEVVVGKPTPVYRINTGSSSAPSPFTGDQYGSGGNPHTVTNAIDTSGVTNPAPAAVYQSERYGNSTYTLPNLTPGGSYTVRLHFAELYQTAAGRRRFDVVINDATVLSSFDIYATVGARYKAVVREFTATASSSGQIVIKFNTITDNATIGGIEIVAANPNLQPIFAIPASAVPRPVPSNTTSLSALGADDGGESSLTYTWAAIQAPPGATVTFSANGTNAAKNTTATFTAAGTYTLEATVKDPSGLSTTSSVKVVVSQVATSIVVSPASATVNTSGTQQFTATTRDQFGAALATQPAFIWTVSYGGSIDARGLFTAGTTPGTYNVIARASSISGTASVTVTTLNMAPTIATPAAASPNPITGAATSLLVLGADDGGEGNLTYTWATTSTPPAAVTFSPNGTNAAKNTTATFTKAGSYTFQVTVKDQPGLSASSTVTVTVNQTLTSVVVSPATATVATSGTQQFAATARDQFAANLSPQPTFTWTVSGGGSISASGLFTAGTTAGGPYTVTARSGSSSGTASVTVASASTYQINCGSTSAASPFKADQYYTGGNVHSVGNTITITGITNPAPMAVYQSERYGTSTYTLPNLTAGRSYTVRLHFAELYQTAANKRKFNVVINNTTVLSSFDLYATAGARYKAVLREFTTTANSSGQIVIKLNNITGYDNATIGGIEIIGR